VTKIITLILENEKIDVTYIIKEHLKNVYGGSLMRLIVKARGL
jgi:hypothetical protein